MTAKEYLQQVKTISVLINKKQEEVNHLKDLAVTITSSSDEEKVQSSSNPERMANTVCKILDLEREIGQEIEKMLEVKKEIMNTIDKLTDPEMIDLLYRRYVRFEKWEKIAYKMNYSLRGVHKLHGRALISISEIIKEVSDGNC